MKSDGMKKTATVALICLVLLLLIGLGLYGWGISRGRAELARQKTAYDTQIAQAHQQLTQSQGQLAAAQTQNRLLTGQSDLYEASISLERRNFGTANDDVQKASQALSQIQAADMGEDFEPLNTLRQTVGSTNVSVASDLQSQRSNILDMAAQINRFVKR